MSFTDLVTHLLVANNLWVTKSKAYIKGTKQGNCLNQIELSPLLSRQEKQIKQIFRWYIIKFPAQVCVIFTNEFVRWRVLLGDITINSSKVVPFALTTVNIFPFSICQKYHSAIPLSCKAVKPSRAPGPNQ